MPPPTPDEPRARALHHLNVLRELRMALHAVGVVASGLRPVDAMVVRSPFMLQIFGWPVPDPEPDMAPLKALWEQAEATTDRLFGAILEVLDETEQRELTTLLDAALLAAGG